MPFGRQYFGHRVSLCEYALWQGTLTEREKLSTVDLLIKVACFVKKVNNIFKYKNT
jgi:hypothetical protein